MLLLVQKQIDLMCSFVYMEHIFILRVVCHLPVINRYRQRCVTFIHSSTKYILIPFYGPNTVQEVSVWPKLSHQRVPCAPGVFVAVVHCFDLWHWLFGIIRTRNSLFCLFNSKSASLLQHIVDICILSCTFIEIFAYCSFNHLTFFLKWLLSIFQK